MFRPSPAHGPGGLTVIKPSSLNIDGPSKRTTSAHLLHWRSLSPPRKPPGGPSKRPRIGLLWGRGASPLSCLPEWESPIPSSDSIRYGFRLRVVADSAPLGLLASLNSIGIQAGSPARRMLALPYRMSGTCHIFAFLKFHTRTE